jgi:ectoine hydroxylase-related dioxygenase (phytanoyl-CoA dioxygenase family)
MKFFLHKKLILPNIKSNHVRFLLKNGYYKTSIKQLSLEDTELPVLFDLCLSQSTLIRNSLKNINSKNQYQRFYFDEESYFSYEDPLYKLANSKALTRIVNEYLGSFYLQHLNYSESYYDGQSPRVGSQGWHRDPESLQPLKVFIYLKDCPPNSGATKLVPNSHTMGDGFKQPFPFIGGHRSLFLKGGKLKLFLDQKSEEMYGQKGDIIFMQPKGYN